LWQAITVLEAREMLNATTVGDMPHLKKEARRTEYKKLHKKAFPYNSDAAAPVSTEDLAKLLAGGS